VGRHARVATFGLLIGGPFPAALAGALGVTVTIDGCARYGAADGPEGQDASAEADPTDAGSDASTDASGEVDARPVEPCSEDTLLVGVEDGNVSDDLPAKAFDIYGYVYSGPTRTARCVQIHVLDGKGAEVLLAVYEGSVPKPSLAATASIRMVGVGWNSAVLDRDVELENGATYWIGAVPMTPIKVVAPPCEMGDLPRYTTTLDPVIIPGTFPDVASNRVRCNAAFYLSP